MGERMKWLLQGAFSVMCMQKDDRAETECLSSTPTQRGSTCVLRRSLIVRECDSEGNNERHTEYNKLGMSFETHTYFTVKPQMLSIKMMQ